MAFDFYDLEDIHLTTKKFEIEIRDFDTIKEILLEFQTKSGVYIDPYGTTRLYPNQVLQIAAAIQKQIDRLNIKESKREKEILIQIYAHLLTVDTGFLLIGD